MERIEAFRTADGVCHQSAAVAIRHAQRRYDDAMTALRVALCMSDTSLGMRQAFACMSWIEENFAAIQETACLRDDITVPPEAEE